jgi:hypothetical protein
MLWDRAYRTLYSTTAQKAQYASTIETAHANNNITLILLLVLLYVPLYRNLLPRVPAPKDQNQETPRMTDTFRDRAYRTLYSTTAQKTHHKITAETAHHQRIILYPSFP